MAEKQTEEQRLDPETAPDPDEDDLSDLDDMLDEFSSAKLTDKKPAASSTATTTTTAPPPAAPQPALQDDAIDEEEFARQLQVGMASLLGGLDDNPAMQKEFEAMMKELGAAAAEADIGSDPSAPIPAAVAAAATAVTTAGTASAPPQLPTKQQPASTTTASKKTPEPSFQETIRKTMERMQNSGETASAAATSSGSAEEDILAQMLREMENGGFGEGGAGDGSEEDLNKMLMGMMEQLTNKDILYEPMKELHDKFPAWLALNRDGCKKQDLERYEEQKTVVDEIVARFERKGYNDDSAADREYIVERMQKMQAAGAPPPDLVGDMSAAQEALGEMDAGCPQQ